MWALCSGCFAISLAIAEMEAEADPWSGPCAQAAISPTQSKATKIHCSPQRQEGRAHLLTRGLRP